MTPTKDLISIEEAMYWFDYNPDTGVLTWKRKRTRNEVGQVIKGPTVALHDNRVKRSMKIARVIWMIQTGEAPPPVVDHRNGVRNDNRWTNLRAATHRQNQYNKTGHGAHPKGVAYDKGRKKPWLARIRTPEGRKNLGRFATCEEAVAAYETAAKELHGEHYMGNQ